MLILKIIFAIFFIYAGIMHFIKPAFFKHFIPNGFPKLTVNYIVGVIEFGLGLGLFFPQVVSYSAYGIFILLIFVSYFLVENPPCDIFQLWWHRKNRKEKI